jgi:hypothetical protein
VNIEHMIVPLQEPVALSTVGANIGGFPCGVVGGLIFILI